MKRKKVLLTAGRKPPLGTTAFHYGDLRPSMGLGFIAAFLEQQGHEVFIRDNYCKPFNMENEIIDIKPDIIGIYMNSGNYYMSLDLIDEIKNITDTLLVAGGPHVSLMPNSVPLAVDYLVTGEGEVPMLDLTEGWRPKDRIIDNAISGRILNLDDMSFPDYKHFIDMPYNWGFDMYGEKDKPIFSMHTSRSCPYRCSFCGVAEIWTRKWTSFSAEKIVKEIDNYVEHYDCKGVYFREDLFTTDLRRVERLCDLLMEKDYKIKWACEARADITDATILEKMSASGCIGVYCGIESGSVSGLLKKKKDLTVETMRKFFSLTKKVGINVYATFCMGTPNETEEEISETNAFIEEVNPYVMDQFAYIAIPKSSDSIYIEENNLYYHKDSAGILYTDRFYELAHRMYGLEDQRVYFLEQQKKFLKENKGKISDEELADYRFLEMPSDYVVKSITENEYMQTSP
jgi:radical SAM superfamily enzyme YgiQ (UPF0313 family)